MAAIRKPEPPRKAQVAEPKKDPISVPVQKAPDPTPEVPKEPPPLEPLVPFKPMAAAEMTLPGVVAQSATDVGGAGAGPGTGAGSGQGSGMGPGFGGGFGGGAYRPGSGITLPTVLREVKPAYTADAMRAKVQGSVWLECIVMPDGSVGDVKVTRSLDPIFGLDQEAIKAAKMWRFRPGMRQGDPVPVIITIELTFTLRYRMRAHDAHSRRVRFFFVLSLAQSPSRRRSRTRRRRFRRARLRVRERRAPA